MSFDTRVGLALAVALPLQLLPWVQMTRHHAVLQWSALAIVAVLAIGWAARRFRLPPYVVLAAQLVAVAAATWAGVWLLHGREQVRRLPELPGQGLDFFRDSAAPLFPNPGASLLIVAGVAWSPSWRTGSPSPGSGPRGRSRRSSRCTWSWRWG